MQSGSVQYHNGGRVVLVSGGCSGIGLAICKAFHESQATVISLDINEQAADQLPDGIHFRRCDTSSEQDCRSAVQWAWESHSRIDVLVNNAGIQPAESYRPLHKLESEVWQKLVDVNFSGYTWLAKHVLARMLEKKQGVIVNVASAQGHRTAREVPAYGPIKAGNLMQARQWAVEYARYGIRVVSVSPGAIDTPLVRASLEEQGGLRQIANRHPLGRIGQPDEVARAILWLASNDASFITGTDLAVDGGLGAFAAFADPYDPDSAQQG